MIYFSAQDYIEAENKFKLIDINRVVDDEFKNKVLYKYYYAYATLKSSQGNYKDAIDKF